MRKIIDIIVDTFKLIIDLFCIVLATAIKYPVIGIAILLIIGLISTIPSMIEDYEYKQAIENCVHEDEYLYGFDIDYENKQLKASCKFCKKEIGFDAIITYLEEGNYEATCISEGLITEYWTFERFPDITRYYSEEIPKKPHTIGEIITEGVEPTCTDEGLTPCYVCSFCKDTIYQETIEPLGHLYKTEGYVAPTCTSLGNTGVEVCVRCYNSEGKDVVIPLAEHDIVYGTFEATYNTSGFKGEGCKNCGCPITIDTFYSDPEVSQYLEYEEYDSDTIMITGVKKSKKDFLIPDFIDGKKVVYLADGLFANDKTIETVKLPKFLEQIGNQVFSECDNLKSIIIPDTVISIGEEAFAYCDNLKFVDLGLGVETIADYAFNRCLGLLSVKFSPNIYDLGSGVFGGDLYSSIPVLYINGYDYPYIPNASHYHKLYEEDMIIEEDGYYYYIGDNEKELVACDKDKVKNKIVTIPEGTDIIGDYFLSRIGEVNAMILPESVYLVGTQSIEIDPNSAYGIFTIYYLGNYDEYNFISFGYLEPYGDAYYDAYFYGKNSDEWGWEYNSQGVPTIKE